MVASNRQTDHPGHLGPIPDDENKVLPVSVIYGANGAGKSNLVKALAFLEKLVVRGTEPKKHIGRRPFLLDAKSAKEPTELAVQFVEDGRAYVLGCRVNSRYVEAEWLSLLRRGKEISIYERLTSSSGEVTIQAGAVLNDPAEGKHDKVQALVRVGVLPNQLFLHAVGKNLLEQDQGLHLAAANRWFAQRLTIIPAGASFSHLAELVVQDQTFTDFAGDFLRKVATGVDRLRVDKAKVDEGTLTALISELRHFIDEMPVGQATSFSSPDGHELIVEKGQGTKLEIRTLRSEHVTGVGSHVSWPFSEESDGTQRLTHLLPALHSLRQQPGVYVIDEIDRSLHPLLAKGFVRTFIEAGAGHGGQMIFTTHDTAFLDLELLRRDEIWFANKKQPQSGTELYSLADYRVRTDLRIDKAYLQGRFEAVPPIEAELPEWVCDIVRELQPKGSALPAAKS